MSIRAIINKKNAVAFLSVIALTGVFVSCQASEKQDSKKTQPAKTTAAESEPKASEQKVSEKSTNENAVVTVYYFHTTMRCHSCNLIEEFTKKAVQENFAEQIKSGRVVVKAVNIDEEQNKHFVKDYKLYTKSVIVSEGSDGKELRWKNLDQVWMLLRDQNKFGEYIRTEVGNYLKG